MLYILFIDKFVKETKKVNLFCGVVLILTGMAPEAVGTLKVTFVTSQHKVRISKYSSFKSNGI